MDATSVFFDMLANFFPLLGIVMLGILILVIALAALYVCISVVVGVIIGVASLLKDGL